MSYASRLILRAASMVVMAVAVAGCSAGPPPRAVSKAPTPSQQAHTAQRFTASVVGTVSVPKAPPVIASGTGSHQGLVLQINSLSRSGNTAILNFTIRNTRSTRFYVQGKFANPAYYNALSFSTYDFSGVYLLDPVTQQKYMPVRDSLNECLCSGRFWNGFAPNSSYHLFVAFAAPTSSKMTVVVPSFPPIANVSVTGPPPASASPAAPGLPLTPPAEAAFPAVYGNGYPTRSTLLPRVVNFSGQVLQNGYGVNAQPGLVQVTLPTDILFAFGSSTLSSQAGPQIQAAASFILTHARSGQTIDIFGYTDNIGTVQYNLVLSQARAQAVYQALAPLLRAKHFHYNIHGYGEADPVAPNTINGQDNPAGRALNRRVTLGITK